MSDREDKALRLVAACLYVNGAEKPDTWAREIVAILRYADLLANVREPSGDGNDGGTVAVNDDGLRARIEALCDEADANPAWFIGDSPSVEVTALRAALAGDPETGQA